jgi:alkaline phosphatase D
LRLLVSSIQVLAEGHGWERWGNLPRERQRLFDLIGRTGAQGVVFVSGDRHLGALYQETDRTPYALVEMTSSGLTKSYRSGEPGPNRLGAPYGEINFGLVDIDWAAGRVHLSIRGADGAPARSVARDLATLRAG